MAWLLFIDESGQDRRQSPYEVLAGVAVKDSQLWPLIQAMHAAELLRFGRRYSGGTRELKAAKILKTKTFHHSRLNATVRPDEVPELACASLDDGAANNSVRHLKALAMAKLEYSRDVFALCRHHGCKAFASVVETDAPATALDGLRKDYAYLFERFYYFLEDQQRPGFEPEKGIIVFDELEKSRSHILIEQAHRYFKDTATGRARASLIIPEPFFVHSDLTTGIQLADLAAYTISWGFRTPQMTKPARDELSPYASAIAELRHKSTRPRNDNPAWNIWSFAHITDLRTQQERDAN